MGFRRHEAVVLKQGQVVDDGPEVGLVEAFREDRSPVLVADVGVLALRLQQAIDPRGALVVPFRLAPIEAARQFGGCRDALELGQMLR